MTSPVPATKRPRTGPYTVSRPKYFNVPKNEAEILDFSPGADTPERKLKDLLLSDDEHTKVTAAVGMGGVGKTTDLCALGHNPQVWLKYRDGIWFIQLGQDITLDDLRVELNVLARKICSPQFAVHFSESLSHRRGLVAALRELMEELEKMDFLLIFDDVWEENEAYDIVKHIANAVSTCSGRLAMLISTRREEIAYCLLTNAVVDVGPKDSQGILSRRILCVHAGINPVSLPHPSSNAGKAVEGILERCYGLPLALAVAGCIVRSYMRDTEEEEGRQHWWVMLRDSLNLNITRLGEKGSNEHKDGLFACVKASMHLVERKWSSGTRETASGLLSSLCIFPKQTWILLGTLQRMWGMKSEEAESFIEMLSDYSIVSRVVRNGKHGMRVHDLVLDYCEELAKDNGTTLEWHKRLVHGYSHDLDKVKGEEVPCVDWWSEKLSADGYIRVNVVRHLLGCGMINEAVRLVCDYRWVQRLNKESSRVPFQQCISDLKRIEHSISTYAAAGSELENGVGLLRDTMELCVYACARNRAECTFQLHGRLSSLVSAPDLFVRCLWSIETYATGMWAKAAPGVLRGAGESLKGTIPVPFNVCHVVIGMDSDELVLGGDGGEVAVMGLDDGVLQWEVKGHLKQVTGLEIDRRTGEMFSSSKDGTVGAWRKGMRVRQFHPFGVGAGEWVTCMKLLLPFNMIACGSNKGKLILVDMETGRIGRTLNGHTIEITSLAVREDGELLISASYDNTVQRWDMKSSQPIGEPLWGQTSALSCMDLSPDGHLMASGSTMDRKVHLWDVQRGVEICAALRGHNSPVESVMFSRKGDVLFSGTWNEIMVWDVRISQSGASMKHRLTHDMGYIQSLCLSHDGEELFATSRWKRKIFVWRPEARQAVPSSSSPEGSFAGAITLFGISPNGETMATYSSYSEKTIDIRTVRDVSRGIDRVLCSCPVTELDHIGRIAVTNDMKLVAYCERWRSTTVYVARTNPKEVVHRLTELSDWHRSLGKGYREVHISTVVFDPEGFTITAEARARARRYPNDELISKSMKWSTATGQLFPTRSAARTITTKGRNVLEAPSRSSAPHLSMKKAYIDDVQIGNEVLLSDGSRTLTGGTVDFEPRFSHYDDSARRLWIASYDIGLTFFDLIKSPEPDLETAPPSIPILFRPPPSQAHNGVPPPTTPKLSATFTIFISYSGCDKPLADWFHKTFTALGISVFAAKREIRVGQDASEVMIQAMENADVAIIIVSPEYAAKKWTMRELQCFRRRVQDAKKKGAVAPVVIPLFFRMGPAGCKSPDILDMQTEGGENVFNKHNFFRRISKREDLRDMVEGMRWIGGLQGIEKPKEVSEKPRPGQSEVEWVKELQGMLQQVVAEADKAVRSLRSVPVSHRADAAFGFLGPSAGPSSRT